MSGSTKASVLIAGDMSSIWSSLLDLVKLGSAQESAGRLGWLDGARNNVNTDQDT